MTTEQFQSFDTDVRNIGSYQYSTGLRYSSTAANQRMTDLTIAALDWSGLRVLDVGCGDGAYTLEIARRGHPREIHGIDLAPAAIDAARARTTSPEVSFSVCSADGLPFGDDSWDIVNLRGVLHHMDDPRRGVAEALRVAPRVFVIEPNGWNLGLKVIEKASPYHRAHRERSFTSRKINGWFHEQGARIVWRRWAGFVPMFSPDPLARGMKLLEPVVENVPPLNWLGAAVYAVLGERPVRRSA